MIKSDVEGGANKRSYNYRVRRVFFAAVVPVFLTSGLGGND